MYKSGFYSFINSALTFILEGEKLSFYYIGDLDLIRQADLQKAYSTQGCLCDNCWTTIAAAADSKFCFFFSSERAWSVGE